VASAVRCLVDGARRVAGLAALRADGDLTAAARGHAEDMVARHYFSHDTPEGGHGADRAIAAGYQPAQFGEAIAVGTVPADTARQIVEAWLQSPPHRELLLAAPYRDAGVWVAPGTPDGLDGATFVFDLGDR
jgi:uncharacterized protein YkwD